MTGIVPTGLETRPSVKQEDRPYMEAFRVLSQSRMFGSHLPMPISLSDIYAFLCLSGEKDAAQSLSFVRIIQRLDQAYLSHHIKKAERKA